MKNGNISHPDTQTARVIAERSDTKYDQILRPLTRERKPLGTGDFVAIGFDTEFDPSGKLLSVQYSVVVPPLGNIESVVIHRGELNKESLFADIVSFLGKEPPPLVVLISHFATAEVSHIKDALKDFRIRSFNRALEAVTDYEPEPEQYLGSGDVPFSDGTTGNTRLRIVDLFGFVPSSLDKIGKSLGFEKLSLEGIAGKSEGYWKTHMDELLLDYPKEFDRYAKRDAEVALLAWVRLRTFSLEKYGLDILNFHTTAGLALGIFRKKYLSSWGKDVAPSFLEVETYNRFSKRKNSYVTAKRNHRYLQIDWRIIRDFAHRCYWGGHAESYGRGIFEEPLAYYDVESLYPSSAALQPLPNAETKWIRFDTAKALDSVKDLEGFAEVSFRFPDGTIYPNLLIHGHSEKLYFPLSGTTYVTLSEIREAQRLGAEITKISGIGFKPGLAEVNHPVRGFAIEFLRLKKESTKDSYERDLYKLILNSLIGKFGEIKKGGEVQRISSLVSEGKIAPEEAPKLYAAYERAQRAGHKEPKDVGPGWWIEATSLILGKARALMSEFVSKGAYFTATDSVLLPRTTTIDCPALASLKSIGSDLKLEALPDKAWLMRTKVYVLWENGKAVKSAHHGITMEDREFVRWVEDSIALGNALPLVATRTHIFSFREALTKGEKFGSSVVKTAHPSMEWDNKRDMLRGEPPLFSGEGALFPPHREMPEKMKTVGRPSNFTEQEQERIRTLLREGIRMSDIVKEVPHSTKWSVLRLLREDRKVR